MLRRRGALNAGHRLDQRRLAGAVVAEESDRLAGIDVEVHLVDGDRAAEALGQLATAQHRQQPLRMRRLRNGGGAAASCERAHGKNLPLAWSTRTAMMMTA